ncbi:LAFA_0C04478g1_1 [Lachancea sp. 'fantastica']|nr:LAFA_0C04478g1_1 [Lachancea sp. 'fantastica']
MKHGPELCKKLELAFSECENDALSLVTIIDLYSVDLINESFRADKAQFLQIILSNLRKNPRLAEQIGWDLPKILLKFLDIRNIEPNVSLSQNAVISTAIKCFNEIALSGNAKECFLAGCEIIEELSVQDIEPENEPEGDYDDETEDDGDFDDNDTDRTFSEDGDHNASTEEIAARIAMEKAASQAIIDVIDRDPQEYALGLQLHALMELISTTIKRIHTSYPSKFLATAVGAILSFIKTNAPLIDDCVFVLRRIYMFCRNYIPPLPQADATNTLDPEEVEKLSEDENALQRKLLQCLLTNAVGQLLLTRQMHTAAEYVMKLKKIDTSSFEYPIRQNMRSMIGRCYHLAYSFDIDIKEAFIIQCVKESVSIYQSLPKDSEIVNETAKSGITQLIYQLAHTYNIQKKLTERNLSLDPAGILALATYHYQETGKILHPQIRIDETIYMFLRFFTPEVYSQTTPNLYAIECCQFWIWVAVTNSSCTENQAILKTMPSYIVATFLQIQLLRSFNEATEAPRMASFTLLTRLMCLIPEADAFEFVKDTMLNCPSNPMKCCILGILKDLMMNVRGSMADASKLLSKLSLSDETTQPSKQPSKPELPSRPYMIINEDRKATIHALAIMSFEDSKNAPIKENLMLSLTYLNFFVSLRLKWDRTLLMEIRDTAKKTVGQLEDKSQPEIEFIKLANENLETFLSQ